MKITPESPLCTTILGLAFLKKGNLADAIEEFRFVLSRDPQNLKCRLNLAAAFLESGRAVEAVMEYQKALAIRPDFAQGHLDLGKAYLRTGRLADAMAQFKIALQLQPRYADAEYNLGLAEILNGNRVRKAIRHWREALKTDPLNVAAQTVLAWTLATAPEPTLRNGPEALRSQHLSQTREASNPRLLRVLAAAYAEVGRFAEAIETAQRGIALATSQNQAELAARLQGDLKLFQSAQPVRDAGESPTTR